MGFYILWSRSGVEEVIMELNKPYKSSEIAEGIFHVSTKTFQNKRKHYGVEEWLWGKVDITPITNEQIYPDAIKMDFDRDKKELINSF